KVPGDTMTIEEIDGFFTALLVGPVPLPPGYLDKVWSGEDEKPFPSYDSAEQEAFVHDLLDRHWRTIRTRLEAGFLHRPLGIDEEDFDISLWADGFLRAVALDPPAWDTRANDKKIGHIVKSILALSYAALEEDEEPLSPDLIAGLIDQLPDTIHDLANSKFEMAWRESRSPVHSIKVGRNEPCPCGSGRKYKKCCGAS